jgi:hypothetical protein
MNTPIPAIDERHDIEAGAWFSKLSPELRSGILGAGQHRFFCCDFLVFCEEDQCVTPA